MQRRKYLTAIGSLAAGGAAVMGTGAFTSMTAQRTTMVNVVGDTSAYLNLTPTSEHASLDSEGTLEIDLSRLNPNARIGFTDLFEIQNTSGDDLVVSVGKDANTVYFNPGNHSGLLEQAPDVDNAFISNEEGQSGLAFGSGAASMKTDGTHTYLLDDSQTNKSSSRYDVSLLNPGEAVSVDLWVFTNGNTNVGSGNYPLVVGAVEPGSDYDETATGGDSPPSPP